MSVSGVSTLSSPIMIIKKKKSTCLFSLLASFEHNRERRKNKNRLWASTIAVIITFFIWFIYWYRSWYLDVIYLYLQHLSNEKNVLLSCALKLDNKSLMRLVRKRKPYINSCHNKWWYKKLCIHTEGAFCRVPFMDTCAQVCVCVCVSTALALWIKHNFQNWDHIKWSISFSGSSL